MLPKVKIGVNRDQLLMKSKDKGHSEFNKTNINGAITSDQFTSRTSPDTIILIVVNNEREWLLFKKKFNQL